MAAPPDDRVDEAVRIATAAAPFPRADEAGIDHVRIAIDKKTLHLFGSAATIGNLLGALRTLGDEVTRLRKDVERLQRERDAVRVRPARREEPPRPAPRQPLTLADVPLSLVGGFTPDARMRAAAKRDPLVALAVQATNAAREGASDLDRARLLAMAYAAVRGDLTTFWEASKRRSPRALRKSAKP